VLTLIQDKSIVVPKLGRGNVGAETWNAIARYYIDQGDAGTPDALWLLDHVVEYTTMTSSQPKREVKLQLPALLNTNRYLRQIFKDMFYAHARFYVRLNMDIKKNQLFSFEHAIKYMEPRHRKLIYYIGIELTNLGCATFSAFVRYARLWCSIPFFQPRPGHRRIGPDAGDVEAVVAYAADDEMGNKTPVDYCSNEEVPGFEGWVRPPVTFEVLDTSPRLLSTHYRKLLPDLRKIGEEALIMKTENNLPYRVYHYLAKSDDNSAELQCIKALARTEIMPRFKERGFQSACNHETEVARIVSATVWANKRKYKDNH